MKNVYKDIVNQSELVEKNNNEIKLIYKDIYIWTENIIYLTKLRAKLSDDEYDLLKNVFPLDNINNNENSWEDVTYFNMMNLELMYFEEKDNLREINDNIDFDLWEKQFRNILNDIFTRKGIFQKGNLSESNNDNVNKSIKD